MALIKNEEFMQLRTRDGLENWLRPGTQVRLTEEGAAALNKSFIGHRRTPFVPVPGLTYTIARVVPDSENPNWTRFTLEDMSQLWRFAPENKDGTVVWEPVE